MLDIRATHYVSPLSEVEFASVPLTVHLTNVADETGVVIGAFRVYNDNTGLLIHASEIAPLSLPKAASADATALTDFDPPAPADDVYFVVFDGTVSNALVPDDIGIHLDAWHFDVKPVGMGPAPASHHATHENGGSDEIDCTGLDGTGSAPHAASHENGGADEIETADLGTAETDDTLVLSPDGAGGVEFRAEAAGGAPGGASGNVQYNAAGAFGGTNDLHWDAVNKRLGIKTSSPSVLLEVSGAGAGDAMIAGNARVGRWEGGAAYAAFQNKDTGDLTYRYAFIQDANGDTWFNAETTLSFNLHAGGGYFKISTYILFATKNVGVHLVTPTARVHIAGGTASASTAPLKIDAGTLLTTPEPGAIESDGTHLYWTDSGGTRHQLD